MKYIVSDVIATRGNYQTTTLKRSSPSPLVAFRGQSRFDPIGVDVNKS
jgi:hypothetical protein